MSSALIYRTHVLHHNDDPNLLSWIRVIALRLYIPSPQRFDTGEGKMQNNNIRLISTLLNRPFPSSTFPPELEL